MTFSTILIANRGEIACRVIRTAHRLGYATVAVFSDADRGALHVRMADRAVHIGGSSAADSYLRIDAILDAARRSGADAVHPGYGFLSENPDFAQACLDAGLVFIGPPPQAMRAMGDKALAKRRMQEAGVPCAPGYLGAPEDDDAVLIAQGLALGFPLLVKATAGGGGRGMRRADGPDELPAAIEGARREALSAFGKGSLMLERLIDHGRHIEIQVFADQHGAAVHLGERDCTAQRRRQKVLEEAPSPIVTPALRASMGADAVAAALAVGYQGAGTVEFIVDAQGQHYFLEMNTRLQVEHPVTELITGLDLVEWQLRVAAGEPLPLAQADIRFTGHAMEARLYVEDPYAGFAPQTGQVLWWKPDVALESGVRIDHGLQEGDTVSPYYDPMVAKIIAHGRDRADATRRLRAALQRTPLLGLRNNGRFLADLLAHPDFVQAQMTTTRIDEWAETGAPLLQAPQPSDSAWLAAALALLAAQGHSWRSDSVAAFDMALQCGEQLRRLRLHPDRHGGVAMTLFAAAEGEGKAAVKGAEPSTGTSASAASGSHADSALARHRLVQASVIGFEAGTLRFGLDGVVQSAVALVRGEQVHLALGGDSFVFHEPSAFPASHAAQDPGRARAPVAGKVSRVLVAPGDAVVLGQQLLCVEAMKMEMWLCAQTPGTVNAVHARPGDQVESGALLVEITPDLDSPIAP
jgi:geranyl-CoA carboxylase alpha subunit